ncbi:MAG: aspartate dehydrogenase domain-containing protein [Pseudomonadota bacterium]
MKRVSIMGAGRIGGPVIDFVRGSDPWHLAAVLVRRDRPSAGPKITSDADAFFDLKTDLIIDAAGPDALRAHGERALALANVWTISGTALSDPDLMRRLSKIGEATGHRLRILPGAIGGLDAVSALARDPSMRLGIYGKSPEPIDAPANAFSGSAREASARFPTMVNVAAAAALAGPGLDATSVTLRGDSAGQGHHLGIRAEGSYGRLTVDIDIPPDLGTGDRNPVSASIIAALVRETQTIWVG